MATVVGEFIKDTFFSSSPAIPQEATQYTINITQSSHQTITVTVAGVAHTETFKAPKGSVWSATIEAEEGYTAGTLSATGGTVSGDIYVMASAATANVHTISMTKNETIQHYWLAKSTDVNATPPANGSADWVTDGSIQWNNATDKVLFVGLQMSDGYDKSSYYVNGIEGLAYVSGGDTGYPIYKVVNPKISVDVVLTVGATPVTPPSQVAGTISGQYGWSSAEVTGAAAITWVNGQCTFGSEYTGSIYGSIFTPILPERFKFIIYNGTKYPITRGESVTVDLEAILHQAGYVFPKKNPAVGNEDFSINCTLSEN